MLWHKHTKAPWTPSAVYKYFPNLLLPLCASQSSSIKLRQATEPFLKDGEKQSQDSTEGGDERGFILFILQCLVRVSGPVLLKPEGDAHWGESMAEPGSLMRALIREETQESGNTWMNINLAPIEALPQSACSLLTVLGRGEKSNFGLLSWFSSRRWQFLSRASYDYFTSKGDENMSKSPSLEATMEMSPWY